MSKKQSSEPITDNIKLLNHLYATNGTKDKIKKLKAEIEFFYYGII